MSTPILKISDISKTYKTFHQDQTFVGSLKSFFYRKEILVRALKPISFEVQRGEFLGVLGPNGAGKTTTLKILTGLITPSEGQALAFGQYDTSLRLPAYLKEIGMVMGQRQQLFPDLPALDAFHISKALYGIEESVFEERLKGFLDLLEIDSKVNIPVRKLSLGERMKMELILSMLHHPQILFLDEPTIGLDFHAAKVIREFLRYMNKEFKMTILLTSHYTKDIEELCERVLLINHGQLIYDGPLEKLDERIQGQRIIDLKFKSEEELSIFKTQLSFLQKPVESLTLALHEDPLTQRLLIPTKDTQELLSLIFQQARPNAIADVLVTEQPLDEVFTQIYRNSK